MNDVRHFESGEAGFGRVTAPMFAAILAASADMSLILDADGVVVDRSFGEGDLAAALAHAIVGRPLIEAVTRESRPKIEELLAGASPPGRWRQVNLPTPDGDHDVPLGLQAFGLGGGRTLVVARDERRQAAAQRRFVAAIRETELEAARKRQADLRLQTLIALSGTALLTLDATTLAVLDASPAALALGGPRPGGGIAGWLHPDDAAAARETLAAAVGSARVASFAARLRDGRPATLQAAAIREAEGVRLLVRIAADDRAAAPEAAFVAALPHAVVVTDDALRIESANPAFVEFVQLSFVENAIGQPLDRFVGRGGVDTGIIAAALREAPGVRGFATMLVSHYGQSQPVEIDAVALPEGRIGFLLRAAARRPADARAASLGDGLARGVTDTVGRVAMKEIVRDTTDVIERLCIETAIELTDGNRAAAAEMLGISRQSLYAKLARFGMTARDGEASGSLDSA